MSESPLNKKYTDYKPTQSIPPLFKEIIRTDILIAETREAQIILFETMKRALQRKQELMRAAEKALSWNKDKGNK